VLARVAGDRVLDVGCGTGVFLRLCADRGAAVAGIDASEELLAVARERVPEADLRAGDLQTLPFADDAFDLVTGFGSFFYAADVAAALREAARVTRPGGALVVQVFGRPERCDLEALKPNPGAWRPEIVEELMPLPVEESFDVSWAYEYAGDDELVTAIQAGGAVSQPAERILQALAHCQQADGRYRVSNEWHIVVARA
jgi:ubiquinone/menaquinone biosynthesis C-methylase UbiE